MSWSDDTRCLYCEGKLPLYRKVTHGQFCSSAHRKSYWQEQERLALERLQQSHITLSSNRPPLAEDLIARPELRVPQPVIPAFEASVSISIPEEAPQFDAAVPDLGGALLLQFEATSGSVPDRIVADPFEYDVTSQPLPPSAVWAGPRTKSLPEGKRVAFWSSLIPHSWTAPMELAAAPFEGVLIHPRSVASALQPAVAKRVGLLLSTGSESRQTSGVRTNLDPIEAKPAPATNIVLEVPPQNDVLVQLLDQQVPHPDQLLALARFAAQEQPFALAAPAQESVATSAETILPNAASVSAMAPEYQLATASKRAMVKVVAANRGSFASCTEIAEIAVQPSLAMLSAVMATGAIEVPSYQVGAAGLRSLPTGMIAAQGAFAKFASAAEVALAGSADIALPALCDVPNASLGPRFAGIKSLPSTVVLPAQGIFAGQSSASEVLRASADVALPRLSAEAIDTFGPRFTNLLPLPSDTVLPALGMFASPMATSDVAMDLSSAVSGDLAMPGFSHASATDAAFAPRFTGFLRLPFGDERVLGGEVPQPAPVGRLIPQTVELQPIVVGSRLEPMDRKPPEDALRPHGGGVGAFMRGHGLEKLEPVWAHAAGFLQHAPRDLKLLLLVIPALLALVFHPGLPRVAFAAPQSAGGFPSQFKRVLNEQFVSVRQTLEHRAAIALDEDFRSGLDNWASPGGSTTEWSFDQSGFVQPGPLALYRPSVMLADYQVQFMGLIDKKAMSWVVRAADFENFYVVKLVVTKPGAIPTIGLTRYAVINGKAQDRHDVNIPLSAREDTLYNIRMDVRGSNFNVEVQGQMADSWTETRLPRGGVGFFTARGEASRVRWVQITHQYDMLGRLCAYLAPYDTTNGSWQP
jgi:hypothetical protein